MRREKNTTTRLSAWQNFFRSARAGRALHFVAAGSALLLVPKLHPARAATITWTGLGSDSNWGTTQNWSGTVGLPSGSNVQFAGSTQLSNNNNLPSATYPTLVFNTGAGAFVLTGDGITLNASSAAGVTNLSTSLETINLPLTVSSGARTIDAANGNISIGGGLAGTSGVFFGQHPGLTGTPAPVATAVVILNSVATYSTSSNVTPATAVDSSTLQIGVGGALPTTNTFASTQTGYVTLGNSTTNNSGVLELGDSTTAINSTINSLTTAGTGTGNEVIGGNSGISTLTIDFLNTAATDTVKALIGGTGANQNNIALTKSGGSTVSLTAPNTYIGNTTISAGTLALSSTGSIAKSPLIIVGLSAGSSAKFDVSAVSGGFSLPNGQTIEGGGTVVGSMNVASGSTLSPGNSPGTLTDNGAVTYSGGGTYLWQINQADGTAGSDPGWDLESITGALNITATSGSKFNIDITSLTTGDVAGQATDFDPTASYAWVIASAAGGITGFDPSEFNLDASGFANPTTGNFGIMTSGNNLEVTYTGAPVPEPTMIAGALAIGAVGLLSRRRRGVAAAL
jgi:autotransporter-associated beta strand protein